MAIKAIIFEIATDRNDVRLAVHNATESRYPSGLKHLARFDFIEHRHHVHASSTQWNHRELLRTTSTEQCARAATAAETLPRMNRSKRLLNPVEPTKMQSAPHSSAALHSSRLGSPSLTTQVTFIAAARKSSRERFEIFSTHAFSSLLSSSIVSPSGGISFPRKSGANGSSTRTTITSLRRGHLRAATARNASSLAGEPSVPTMILTGEFGSSTRPRAILTEQRASVRTR